MNLGELSISQLTKLAGVLMEQTPQHTCCSNAYPSFGILVLNRGFVYVGELEFDEHKCILRNGSHVRVRGATKGLGQLSREGPQLHTKLDLVADTYVPLHTVNHVIATEESLWKSS